MPPPHDTGKCGGLAARALGQHQRIPPFLGPQGWGSPLPMTTMGASGLPSSPAAFEAAGKLPRTAGTAAPVSRALPSRAGTSRRATWGSAMRSESAGARPVARTGAPLSGVAIKDDTAPQDASASSAQSSMPPARIAPLSAQTLRLCILKRRGFASARSSWQDTNAQGNIPAQVSDHEEWGSAGQQRLRPPERRHSSSTTMTVTHTTFSSCAGR